MFIKYKRTRPFLSVLFSILVLFMNSIPVFADTETIPEETRYYRVYIATEFDKIYFKISENIVQAITTEMSACSIYGPGSISTPAETGDSPSLCWVAGQWGDCDNTCGPGTTSREFKCLDLDSSVSTGCLEELKLSTTKGCKSFTDCSYSWDYSVWGSCSSNCGNGIQTRTANCERGDGTIVDDSYCTNEAILTQPCFDTSFCTHSWEYDEWGACSTTCGTGTQYRTATCLRSDGTTVTNSSCTGTATTSQACTDVSTCNYSWNTTAWDSCSNTCGTGAQTRASTCKRSDGATVENTFCTAKPSGSQTCTDVSTCTYSWNTTAWGSCSNTCGAGTQTRTSACKRSDGITVADTFCPAKPSGSQACSVYTSCTYNWSYSVWGGCSTTCGTGTQSRTVACIRSDGTTVANSYCGTATTSRSCSAYTSCTYTPQYGAYGSCGFTCPTRYKTRPATCLRSDGVIVSNSNCSFTNLTVSCGVCDTTCTQSAVWYSISGTIISHKEDCSPGYDCVGGRCYNENGGGGD